MNLYNNKIIRRWNSFIRRNFVLPKMQKETNINKMSEVTLLSNNCLGGVVLHDFSLQFNTPTVNLFFHSLDFFTFAEHLEHYLSVDICPCENPKYKPDDIEYPIMTLPGNSIFPDLELHFLHYHSIQDAMDTWNRRKARINWNRLYVVWTFSFGEYDEEIMFPRFEAIPVQNKIAFVNHPVDAEKYPHLFYIKGFEKEKSLGQILDYQNLFGKRFYDQFDWAGWLAQ